MMTRIWKSFNRPPSGGLTGAMFPIDGKILFDGKPEATGNLDSGVDVDGFEFVVGDRAGKPTLTIRDAQQEYVFE